MSPHEGQVTKLLRLLNEGDDEALAALVPLVYGELRGLAGGYLRGERPDHTLQPTALVHEAYARLVGEKTPEFESRGHFLAVAANSMRQILVNHAKGRGRLKRGGDRERVALDDDMTAINAPDVDLVALDEAMRRLAEINPRKVQVVEMRFFVGLSVEETAAALRVSEATVRRDWDFARTWLMRQLESNG